LSPPGGLGFTDVKQWPAIELLTPQKGFHVVNVHAIRQEIRDVLSLGADVESVRLADLSIRSFQSLHERASKWWQGDGNREQKDPSGGQDADRKNRTYNPSGCVLQ